LTLFGMTTSVIRRSRGWGLSTKCPVCGSMIDCRDLAIVMAHLKPLPHPEQNQTN